MSCSSAARRQFSIPIFRRVCSLLSLFSDAEVGSERRTMNFEVSAVTRVAVGRSWTLEMQRLGRVTGRHLALVSLALAASCNAHIPGVAGPDFGVSARVEPIAVIAPTKLDVSTFVKAANREAEIVGAKQTCFAN